MAFVLTPADKRVLRAFANREEASSKKLRSDRQSLFLESSRIATWQQDLVDTEEGDRRVLLIAVYETGATGQTIAEYLRTLDPHGRLPVELVKQRSSGAAVVRNGLVFDQSTGIWK